MTPHIEATPNQIAETVLMPGDPLRAKYIADNFLENAELVSSVRNIYAYTGNYKGKRITVMASGMGIPSMGIYSYELYKFYDVQNIIRIGTTGAYDKNLKLLDVILVKQSYSKSPYAKILNGNNDESISSSEELNKLIQEQADLKKINLHVGNILCSDVFYSENKEFEEYKKYGCIGVEMESFALFANAKALRQKAACLLTVSDIVGATNERELTPEERQNSLNQMIELAMEAAVKL